MTASTYPAPLDKLLTYGDCRKIRKWPDYIEKFGLEPEHISDLTRMATDPELNWADSDSLEVWAPIHAWRALGQLKAEAAIDPLISIFDEMEDSDWFNEEMPEVFAMIGPAAIPALKTFLADSSHPMFPQVTAANCLSYIGKEHPDARSECVAVLTEQLEQFQKNSPDLNGFLVTYLVDLKAVESAATIERAFAAKWVDPSIIGDWIDVQYRLGLINRAEMHELRTTVDAEHLGARAAKPIAEPPRGFGTAQKKPAKKGKK